MTATLTSFDLNIPGDSITIGQLPAAIRNAKNEITFRVEQEHSDFTSTGLFGGFHLAGSARAYVSTSQPALRPDGTTALDSQSFDDDGRIWVDKATDILHYRNSGAWQAIAIASGSAAGFAALGGRSGGQVLIGGIDLSDDLELNASSDATPGNIIFDNAAAMLMNNIPITGLTLGADADAGGFRIADVGAPTTDGDPLIRGSKKVRLEEIDTTGQVVVGAFGTNAGSASTQTVTIGFVPDYVMVSNDSTNQAVFWTAQLGGNNKGFGGGVTAGNEAVTISGQVLSFPVSIFGNITGFTFWYHALKFNLTTLDPS